MNDLNLKVTRGNAMMLYAMEFFHNCTNRVLLNYDEKIKNMPLDKQGTAFRGKTILQTEEEGLQ